MARVGRKGVRGGSNGTGGLVCVEEEGSGRREGWVAGRRRGTEKGERRETRRERARWGGGAREEERERSEGGSKIRGRGIG
eukprot:507518-Rhodomonas_salina.1